MSLWDQRIGDLRDEAASAAPTPGGGSVACVCATLGVSLVVMALEITRAKQPEESTDALLAEARALMASLSRHADRDVEVFLSYMEALRLPRSTDPEKAARAAAISVAALGAAEAPMAAARDVTASLAVASRAERIVKKEVLSDVLAGADLLAGAGEAALRNVDINLPAIRDLARREALRAERGRLAAGFARSRGGGQAD